MGKKLQLVAHLSTDDLARRYRHAAEATERSWWQILWLLARGQSAPAVADSTGYSRYWIGQLVRRYNTQGPASMVNRRRRTARRAPRLLSSAQIAELCQALAGRAPHGERWTSRQVADGMAARLGRPVAKQQGWDYLQRVKARLRQPRPRHVAARAEDQEAFKRGAAS
jgi:transposase